MNARSVRNKVLMITEYITDNDIDIAGITETWLSESDNDTMTVNDLCPAGYRLHQIPRKTRGGGVAIICKQSLDIKMCPLVNSKSSFEYIEVIISHQSTSTRLIVVYRPPPSAKNKLTPAMFMEDFDDLLNSHTTTSGNLLICGDLNIHMDSLLNNDTVKFNSLLLAHDLQQHVEKPTHCKGHILDLLISRKSEDVIRNINVTEPASTLRSFSSQLHSIITKAST
jgi:exonuclease III